MMALSGVRSSWLMLAMNSDFTLLASSASIRAVLSASQAFWRNMESASVVEYSAINEPLLAEPTAPPIMDANRLLAQNREGQTLGARQ